MMNESKIPTSTPKANPLETKDDNSYKFDAEGNPRLHRPMPDGTDAFLSKQEYEETMETYKGFDK
ncbi:MAG TPA: hypothetical protein PKZ56_01440 [Candidatus Paceibacterota bacterium]|jgi:hypothetical protein|nr:hypothetical protein [Candidatus Paceibacterota bacterium]